MNSTIQEANKKRRKKYDSVSYLTGDIDLNIKRFNRLMGTDDLVGADTEQSKSIDAAIDNILAGTDLASAASTESNGEGLSSGASEGCCESLIESKRYVRRYYVRPQNIFCSNKAEVLKALVELNDKDCTIYTLNNLGDDKDVSKLMNSDIIYYYDNGILYDKNRVKVMDYDLSIKKEENRKHFADIDQASEKEFEAEYKDRMTDATELEETMAISTDVSADDENPFDQDFDTVNVFGENLTEAKEKFCCICGELIVGYGNNPEPVRPASDGPCCDSCNIKFVVPARLDEFDYNIHEED